MSGTNGFLAAVALAALSAGCTPDGGEWNRKEVALAGVPGLRMPALTGDTTVNVRRVLEGPALGWGSTPSPDGRYVTVEVDAGSLGRIDLLSGDTLPIKAKGTWSEAAEWAETTAFSPDGTQVAYVYGASQGYEIRVSNVDGSGERILVGSDPEFYAVLGPWKGDEILATYYRDEATGMEVVGISTKDGSLRPILAFGPQWGHRRLEVPLAVSPDGRFFTFGLRSPEGDADVVIARTTDGSETGRITGPATDIPLAWTPDGSALLLYSRDRQMTEGVWRVAVRDGGPTGEPELVRGDLWNFEAIGASQDAYFFSLKTDMPRVRVADFDPVTGRLLSEPTAASGVSTGPNRLPIWSPDGRAMAFIRNAPTDFSGGDESILVVRSISGPDAKEIPLSGMSMRSLQTWTADGKIIGTGKGGGDGDFHIWSIDLTTGQVQTLANESDLHGLIPRAISPDGRTGYYGRPGGDGRMMALDLATGRETTLAGPPTGTRYERGPYISPDGKTLAVILSDENRSHTLVAIMSASGGPLRELFRRPAPDGISQSTGVFWGAGGRQELFFSTHGVPDSGEPERLWKADYSGTEPVVTEVKGVGGLREAADVRVSPDGSKIAFVSGKPRGEVWMMTNLSGGRH